MFTGQSTTFLRLAFPLWLVKPFDVQIPFLHDYTPKFWWLNPTVRQMNSRLVAKLSFEMARPLDFVCSVCSYVLTIHIHHPPTLTSPEARRLRLDRRPPHVLGSAQARPTKTGKLAVLKNDLVNCLTFSKIHVLIVCSRPMYFKLLQYDHQKSPSSVGS